MSPNDCSQIGLITLFPVGLFSKLTSSPSLTTLYATLHANIHAKPASLKVLHQISATNIALAWSTPLFELYCVAPATTSRPALAQAAMNAVQWVRREEERVFIIGGAVF
jgi:hypothetical protein